MGAKKITALLLFCLLIAVTAVILSARVNKPRHIHILDIKMATGLDEKLMPVKVTKVFPKETNRIFCWFQWRDAQVNSQLLAKWHYVSDDIRILDYAFEIPKKESFGSVSLVMPEGKAFPPGEYRIDLTGSKHILKSLTFKIE